MDLLREAVGRGVGRGVGSLGASALWLLRDLWALVCVLPRPFSVKLFIGLLWSGGKILFPVEILPDLVLDPRSSHMK